MDKFGKYVVLCIVGIFPAASFLAIREGSFGRKSMSEEYTGRIRFIAAPRGQAPLWVREAWIGLVVPCSPFTNTPPKGSLHEVEDGAAVSYECALVPQKAAVDALEQHNAQAAQWWRQNGFGSEFAPLFAFSSESFEVVEGVQKTKMIVYDDLETGRWEPRDSGR
jgi:hypothetical protein